MRRNKLICIVGMLLAGYWGCTAFGDGKRETEVTWGNTYAGMAMSAKCEKDTYRIGDEIAIRLRIRNFTEENIEVLWVNSDFQTYRLGLFYADGSPVPKSEYAEKIEKVILKGGGPIGSASGRTLKPGDEKSGILYLSPWFKIDKEGEYSLVVIRRLSWKWDQGFIISNLVKFQVTKGKPKDK